MNVHISYKLRKTPDLEKEINHLVEKLRKRLQVFRPELLHLKAVVEQASPRKAVTVSLNLRMSFALKPRCGLALLRIRSISSKTTSKSVSVRAGTIKAVSFPRRVIPIRSPSPARSTSSESFCLASNNPTVRMSLPQTI